jgi:hypothetical protein
LEVAGQQGQVPGQATQDLMEIHLPLPTLERQSVPLEVEVAVVTPFQPDQH